MRTDQLGPQNMIISRTADDLRTVLKGLPEETGCNSYLFEMVRQERERARKYEDRLLDLNRQYGKLEGELKGVQSARHEEQVAFHMAMRRVIEACESFREDGPYDEENALRRVLGIYEIAASYLPAEV